MIATTQFNPAVPTHDAALRALELIATEVAPALGWFRSGPGRSHWTSTTCQLSLCVPALLPTVWYVGAAVGSYRGPDPPRGGAMADIVVLSGDPRVRSRTSALARSLGHALAADRSASPSTFVALGALGAGLLTDGDAPTAAALAAVQGADVLVVATPACTGTFSGILKVFLERLPANALAGTYAIPVVTASLQSRAELAEGALRRLLGELGAEVADFGLAAAENEVTDPVVIAARYVDELRPAHVRAL
jgi:FMN reductase